MIECVESLHRPFSMNENIVSSQSVSDNSHTKSEIASLTNPMKTYLSWKSLLPAILALAAFFGPLIGVNVTIFSQPILAYFDAGATPTVSLHTGVTINDFGVTLAGYLLDCTANQSAPIAH